MKFLLLTFLSVSAFAEDSNDCFKLFLTNEEIQAAEADQYLEMSGVLSEILNYKENRAIQTAEGTYKLLSGNNNFSPVLKISSRVGEVSGDLLVKIEGQGALTDGLMRDNIGSISEYDSLPSDRLGQRIPRGARQGGPAITAPIAPGIDIPFARIVDFSVRTFQDDPRFPKIFVTEGRREYFVGVPGSFHESKKVVRISLISPGRIRVVVQFISGDDIISNEAAVYSIE